MFWFCGVFLKDVYNVLLCTILANTNYNEEGVKENVW